MKIAALSFIGCIVASSAFATTDDVRWVNQCVRDSAEYSVSEQIKIMYCTCMVKDGQQRNPLCHAVGEGKP